MMRNILLALAVILSAERAFSAQNIKLGNVDINPFARLTEAYDSNVYLVPHSSSSLITTFSLGLNAEDQFGPRLDIKAGYSLDMLMYSLVPGRNNTLNHAANLDIEALLPRDATLSVKDDFKHTTDRANSELTARIKHLDNTANATLEVPLRGNFGYGVDISHIYTTYTQSGYSYLDHYELLAGLRATYQLQPKTRLSLGYSRGDINYAVKNSTTNTHANDATHNDLILGIDGNIAPKLVGSVQAGVQSRNYAQHLSTAANDSTTFYYSARLTWKMMPRTDMMLYARRGNIESAYGTNRYFTSTLTNISVSHEIRRITATLNLGFEAALYPEISAGYKSKRLDHYTTTGLDVYYQIQKWLKTGFGYAYSNRTSNELYSYKDNTVKLSIEGLF